MNYNAQLKPIRDVRLLTGGNIVKQGEDVYLGFQLFDSAGVLYVPTTTVSAKISNDLGAVVLEIPGTVVGDLVVFEYDENIGFGDFRMEIKVTDGGELIQKYPSNGWFSLKITPSLDDMEYGGAQVVTLETILAEIDVRFEGYQTTIDGVIADLQADMDARLLAMQAVVDEAESQGLYAQAQGDDALAAKVATEEATAEALSTIEATEAERLATASERQATAAERASTIAVRVATEAERLAIKNQQGAFEAAINPKVTNAETKAASAETIAKEAKARADLIIGQTGDSNTEIVDARLKADGTVATTLGAHLRELGAQQLESARQTSTLTTGVAVVNGGVDAIADVEIEGRTLTSLANSNLEAGKQYVLADKKTKVVVADGATYGGVTQSGVAKFTKGTTTVSTANFVGKVLASTTANPHIAKWSTSSSILETPSAFTSENSQAGYSDIATLNGAVRIFASSVSGRVAQSLFSFDIIAEIERKLGVIPKSTLAEKVQWVKDNVESLQANWHGFGSSVGGNKAYLAVHHITLGWSDTINHSAGSVLKLAHTLPSTFVPNRVDANGFVHYLAYAEASDGVTASSISTDYIDLVVTLKATAQLNTRPTIVRVENFEGKVSGSVVENPHVAKSANEPSLLVPSSASFAETTTGYSSIFSLNGSPYLTRSTGANTYIAQHLFSFNLIEAVERNIGRIPRSTTADKVQWLKDNVAKLTANWHGFGSSVGGNKANLAVVNPNQTSWEAPTVTTSSAITKLTMATNNMARIDNAGFIHFLAYAEPSDGTTASTINTDYIDLEIELKPTADFTRPRTPLYEVTSDSYAKILVDWSADDVVNRYPSVEGTQHLQGVGVVAEGENLLPPFSEWTLHANAKMISPYELELVASASNQWTQYDVNVSPNQTYSLALVCSDVNAKISIDQYTNSGVIVGTNQFSLKANPNLVITTVPTATKIKISIASNTTGTFRFTNPMLTLGNVAKPFVPRNPSYLYADVKLGAIGTVADRLYEQDGQRLVRKVVEKDVVLGGDLSWIYEDDFAGFKRVRYVVPNLALLGANNGKGTKYDGKSLFNNLTGQSTDSVDIGFRTTSSLHISLSDSDTGFGETYTPSVAEIKAYFYGYRMNNGVFGTPYDGTGTKTWVPIGDTTNARAVTTVPTSASPTQVDGTIQPYRLSYVLATPQIVNVTDKVEGSLKVNGQTQVEVLSGVVRREKVIPQPTASGTTYEINEKGIYSSIDNPLKNRTLKILAIYKNGLNDTNNWRMIFANANQNGVIAEAVKADFDPTAEYTVTYIALDKPLLTANPTNVKLFYANNVRSALEDVVGEVQDNTTMLSVHEKAIVDLYIRVKALGG